MKIKVNLTISQHNDEPVIMKDVSANMEIVIVLLLIIINGVFAMSEIAIVSSRKSKLQLQANEGNKSAQAALELARSPNKLLSTAQIGITLVGILSGAFGEVAISK